MIEPRSTEQMSETRIARIAVQVIAACALLATSLLAAPPMDSDPLSDARSALSAGSLTVAESLVRNFLGTHPSSADAHFLLGYILFREQKGKDSLAEFTAGAALRRPSAVELKTVASDYVMLGDFADADKWFTAVTAATPEDADAWYLLGRTKYNENAFAESVSSFNRALALHPHSVEAENNLGLALLELNKRDDARAAFQSAIDWQGASPVDPQPFLNLGTYFADQSDLEQALPLLKKADALSTSNPKIHEELAQVYEAQKHLPQAQAELERAVALAPGVSGLHFKLGQIYRKQGMVEQAKNEFAICERLNSAHSSTPTPNPAQPGGTQPK